MSADRIWQVRLSDGSVWIPADARPGDPRASWIYARSTADMFAKELGGTVVEVTQRQHEKVLDREIETVLTEPRPAKAKSPKTRTRPFSRAARRAIATVILEEVPLNNAARAAVDAAREAASDAAHNAAIRTLTAGLPATLWVGYEAPRDQGFAQAAEPVWIADDPHGEDPGQWRRIERDEIARILTEDT